MNADYDREVSYLRVSAFICGLVGITLSAEDGGALYENYCLACHWKDGSPGHGGADLRKPLKYGSDLKSVMRVIKYGVPGSQMPGFADLSENQRRALAKHVISLNQRALKKQK
jgi:mono/diheme cytochrome c family protein